MRLGVLLTKWSLTGVLQNTEILYSVSDHNNQIIVNVKIAKLVKEIDACYVIYKETKIKETGKIRYKLLNADITSDIFHTGVWESGVSLSKLDDGF